MPFVIADLEERAASEVLALRACSRAAQKYLGESSISEMRVLDDGRNVLHIGFVEHVGAEHGHRLARDLVALQLVASVKVMDMLVEWILDANGTPPKWKASEKIVQMRPKLGTLTLPPGIDDATWIQIFELFVSLTPYRNAISHAGWGKVTDAGLEFDCDSRHPERKGTLRLNGTVSHDELSWLRDAMCDAYDAIMHGPGGGVLAARLALALNKLSRFHLQPPLACTAPVDAISVRREVQEYAITLADFDVTLDPIREALAKQRATTDALEITFGNPDTPLTRYLIPWHLLDTETRIQLGPSDTRWTQFRL